jgi:glycine dehydrogenase
MKRDEEMQNILNYDIFENRHIGPSDSDISEMLSKIGVQSLDELIDRTIPANIRLKNEIQLSDTLTESNFIKHLKEIAGKNKVYKSYIGQGYYDTITPAAIVRNILENPGWYTQYTPYQAEISQGRLEALLNFQTMVSDFTAMPLANASLLDEGTAAAEAMSMLYSSRKGDKKNSNTFLVSEKCFPQTLDILKTRSEPLGITLRIDKVIPENLTGDVFAILIQNPDDDGAVHDYENIFNEAKNRNIYIAAACDLLSLALLKPPGELGSRCCSWIYTAIRCSIWLWRSPCSIFCYKGRI